MHPFVRVVASAGAVLLFAAACGGDRGRMAGIPYSPGAVAIVGDMQQSIRLMLSFDANMDGALTRDELEAGLRKQFAEADLDRNGSLSQSEIQAENARRWQASGTASSPLIDWNQDGVVDFAEFAATAHSVFTGLDRDRGGTLAGAELRVPVVRGVRPGGRAEGRRG